MYTARILVPKLIHFHCSFYLILKGFATASWSLRACRDWYLDLFPATVIFAQLRILLIVKAQGQNIEASFKTFDTPASLGLQPCVPHR
jgi:hypothetical protein